jgi:hypothetical protein
LTSLAQLGFEVSTEAIDDDGAEAASLPADGDELPRKILQLSYSTRYAVIFILVEPSVDSSSEWIQWYDRLTNFREMINSA